MDLIVILFVRFRITQYIPGYIDLLNTVILGCRDFICKIQSMHAHISKGATIRILGGGWSFF